MYAVTSRRLPARSSANGTSFGHKSSPSLWPMNFQGEPWTWGVITSRLQRRNMDIMMSDPDVVAVTTLEV